MRPSRWIVALLGLCACAPPPDGDAGADAPLAGDARADDVAQGDGAGDALPPEVGPGDDAGAGDDGALPGASYGQCGRVVFDCRCACGADATCRQQCNSNTVACTDCVNQATARCCPTQLAAVVRCYQLATGTAGDGGAPRDGGAALDAGAADAAIDSGDAEGTGDAAAPCATAECVRMRCATPLAALNACLQTAVATNAACRDGFVACFGNATCM